VKKAKAAKWCLAQFDVEKLREWLAGNGITLDWILGEMLRVYRDPTTPTTARLRILEQFRAFHRVGASLHRSVQHALREDPDQEPWPRHDLPDPLMKKFGLLDRQVE